MGYSLRDCKELDMAEVTEYIYLHSDFGQPIFLLLKNVSFSLETLCY